MCVEYAHVWCVCMCGVCTWYVCMCGVCTCVVCVHVYGVCMCGVCIHVWCVYMCGMCICVWCVCISPYWIHDHPPSLSPPLHTKIYEVWVRDINSERCSLDFMKLCICGHPRVGKSSLKASLSKKEAPPTEGESPNTFGIDVSQVNLSGSNFSVWDFAGQVESFITHQFFISTESTIFTVIVNLVQPFEDQQEELRWWLSFIKARNLGQVPFLAASNESHNYVPMCPGYAEGPPRRPVSSGPPDESSRLSIASEDGMYGSVILPVPVVVIGSHYDLLPSSEAPRALERLQDYANEMRDLFKLYLVLSDKVFPLACHMPKSDEMLKLKQELVSVRSKLMKVHRSK